WGTGFEVQAVQSVARLAYDYANADERGTRLPLAYLQCAGPLQRLQAGSSKASPLGRAVLGRSPPPLAWWSLDHGDDRETTTVASVIFEDGVWHWVRLACCSSGGGAHTAYSVMVDGQVVMSGTATGFPFLPPTGHVISPTGDMDAMSHAVYTSAAGLPADDLYQ